MRVGFENILLEKLGREYTESAESWWSELVIQPCVRSLVMMADREEGAGADDIAQSLAQSEKLVAMSGRVASLNTMMIAIDMCLSLEEMKIGQLDNLIADKVQQEISPRLRTQMPFGHL